MLWELLVLPLLLLCDIAVCGAVAECIVVRVVVRDRTDGAGEENVLSFPRPELTLHPAVVAPSAEEAAPCEGAASECAISVDIVAAVDLLPIVGGGPPSSEMLAECLLRFKDELLIVSPVGTGENDGCL